VTRLRELKTQQHRRYPNPTCTDQGFRFRSWLLADSCVVTPYRSETGASSVVVDTRWMLDYRRFVEQLGCEACVGLECYRYRAGDTSAGEVSLRRVEQFDVIGSRLVQCQSISRALPSLASWMGSVGSGLGHSSRTYSSLDLCLTKD